MLAKENLQFIINQNYSLILKIGFQELWEIRRLVPVRWRNKLSSSCHILEHHPIILDLMSKLNVDIQIDAVVNLHKNLQTYRL